MKNRFILGAAGIFFSSFLFAQENFQKDSSLLLGNVVITANKIEQKQRETGKVMTVVGAAELRQNSSRSVGQILNRQVGLVIGGANNAPGSVQTVYMRGASAANTLILLDGIPLYDASGISSEFDLNTFLPPEIERIEILKGAQSTLYGSDAVAGVINIISKKNTGKRFSGRAGFSGGSYGTFRGDISISGSEKNIRYYAGYNKFTSKGFSSAWDSSGKDGFEKEGVNQDGVMAGIGTRLDKNTDIDLYLKYNRNRGELDAGAFTDDGDYINDISNLVTGIRLTRRIQKGSLHFNYFRNSYERKYDNDSLSIGGYSNDPFAFFMKYNKENYSGISHFAEGYTNVRFNDRLSMVGGIEYRQQNTDQSYLYISNYGPYEPVPLGSDSARVRQISAYGSLLYYHKGLSVGLGGRYNHHSVYGSNGTFSFNPAYITGNYKFFINVASAYRVPSLYQLYSEYGNRSLKPEESVSYEAGGEYNTEKLLARVTFFKRDIRDVFAFYTDPVTFAGKYINEDRQNDHGIELEARVSLFKGFVLSGNYSYVKGEITTVNAAGKDTTFNNLYQRPRNVINLHAEYSKNAFLVSAHWRKVSSSLSPVFGAAPVELGGYYTLDLYGEYKLNDRYLFFADIRNITDVTYFDLLGYRTMGFNCMGGVRVSF